MARRRDELHRGVVDEQVLELDVRELAAVHLAHDLAPEPARLQHVGLVHARDLRPRGSEGDPRDALDLANAVDARVVGDVDVAPALAEVEAARELAHDDQIRALDAVAPQRARVV